MAKTPRAILRQTWHAMIGRCHDPRHRAYRAYGGRGISVCEEWLADFEAFASHLGERPAGDYSLDRINNNGNYEPGNVRWATRETQTINRRRSIVVEYQGKPMLLTRLARMHGINSELALKRYREGWDPISAATTPDPKHVAAMESYEQRRRQEYGWLLIEAIEAQAVTDPK